MPIMYYGPLDLSSYLGAASQNATWSHDMFCSIGDTKFYTTDITKKNANSSYFSPPGASICIIEATSSVVH